MLHACSVPHEPELQQKLPTQLPLVHQLPSEHVPPFACLPLQIPPLQYWELLQLLGQVPPHASAPLHFPAHLGVHPHALGVPLPPHVFGELHFVPQLPQLELSVLKLVQALPQKFGLLAFGQAQLPPEHILPVVVQSWQLEAVPQLWESLELS